MTLTGLDYTAPVTFRPRGASRVDELFPSQDRLQRKKAEKVAMIKAHIGNLLYD